MRKLINKPENIVPELIDGFVLSNTLPGQVNLEDEDLEFKVKANNLNGEKVEADVQVVIEKIKF